MAAPLRKERGSEAARRRGELPERTSTVWMSGKYETLEPREKENDSTQ